MLLKSKIPVSHAFGIFVVIYFDVGIKIVSSFVSETSALVNCNLCISIVEDL